MVGDETPVGLDDDPQWYKDAIIYQLHVKAFFDSNEDGIGDFKGLRRKLDYLQELGVTAIWLLPFYPSPLRDDGYDIADYTGIHPWYGNMRDFRAFLRDAHDRGLRVITELVINHTSDQHQWFQRARSAPAGSADRDFYVWSDTPDRYREARIIFKDFEHSNWAWDPAARAFYWHRFYSHQPDLNFDNPAVLKAVLRVMDDWFEMGVDGMRLDAIPYLVEREGTNCENLPETHAILKQLRAHLDERFHGRMLLAEANQWPEDAAAYFGSGDECQMNFHFPLMPRLFMALHMEDRFPVIDILRQTPPIPAAAQWAIFLRNHDELTLEMVTDEERDYMYRVYAGDPQARINLGIRRRLAPLLESNRRKIELMNSLLLSLPGTPVLYYGDEIGMGDNIYLGDRNGVRTPMQWSADRNAGFSHTNPQRLYLPVITDPEFHYESVNVEAQEKNPSSLLWWMRRLIRLRKQYKAFGRGGIRFLDPSNRKVLVFVREHADERILVVANLSRFTQFVELDLSPYEGAVPVELFGRTKFPVVDRDYFLTLGPHNFYWFALQPESALLTDVTAEARRARETVIEVGQDWTEVLRGRPCARLESLLPAFLRGQRWFGGKSRAIRGAELLDVLNLGESTHARLVLARVDYVDGDSDVYVLPLAYSRRAGDVMDHHPESALALLRTSGATSPGVLHDALLRSDVATALLDAVGARRRIRGAHGELEGSTTRQYRQAQDGDAHLEPAVHRGEQSNTSIYYGDRWVLKLFRRLEEGRSLDLELGLHLTERGFGHTPAIGGALEYRSNGGIPRTLAVLQRFVPNEGDAWKLTLDGLHRYFEAVQTQAWEVPPLATDTASLLHASAQAPTAEARDIVGTHLEDARLLGRRTAELHVALSGGYDDPAFAPEPFTLFYQRSLYQSMRNLTGKVMQSLRVRRSALEADLPELPTLLDGEPRLLDRFHRLLTRKLDVVRIRTHGDYHLGQVLFTGRDFVITDFEGEPARPLSERRMKRSPLRDVAGMLRSFHYAASTARIEAERAGLLHREASDRAELWVRFWYASVAAVYLAGYLRAAQGTTFVPADPAETELLLDAYLLEKAVYEIGYELDNRPDWVRIPARAVLELLGD
jgi:maltose alpha-D-glucosyltransferase / alpha-amylase